MFDKKKGDPTDPAAGTEGEDNTMGPPPLKPFSKRGSHVPNMPPVTSAYRPEIVRRPAEPSGTPRRFERARPVSDGDTKKLTVGRDIHLKGEISSCDKLVVEGRVEASLNQARAIEVAASGYFKGDAQVDEADISGHYEGQLVARHKLTVRSNGRVTGSIRYGRIVIESGGEISGDMQTLGPNEAVTYDDDIAPGERTSDGYSAGRNGD